MNTRISHCGRSCLFDPLKCFGVIGCFDESCKHELERWERLFYDAIGVYGSYWVFPYVEAGYLRDEWCDVSMPCRVRMSFAASRSRGIFFSTSGSIAGRMMSVRSSG